MPAIERHGGSPEKRLVALKKQASWLSPGPLRARSAPLRVALAVVPFVPDASQPTAAGPQVRF